MMKERRLDRNNVLRPTAGDPWDVKQYHWNTGAKENLHFNPVGVKISFQLVLCRVAAVKRLPEHQP